MMRAWYWSYDIREVLKWYKEHWQKIHEWGGCTFYLYENDRELDFEEKYNLGFFDYDL